MWERRPGLSSNAPLGRYHEEAASCRFTNVQSPDPEGVLARIQKELAELCDKAGIEPKLRGKIWRTSRLLQAGSGFTWGTLDVDYRIRELVRVMLGCLEEAAGTLRWPGSAACETNGRPAKWA